ncbi:MAG: amidase family protein [Candidatus Woesebacteria bacterium]
MLRTLTLKSYLDKVKSKEISPSDVVKEVADAIETINPDLNIFLARNPKAFEQSEERAKLPLSGAPIAVKDNFLTVGMITTASSKVLEHFNPPYESTVTKNLSTAGGVIIGKTNMDAWAHGSSTETSDFGVTKNPRNPEYLPGGSSGGNAAAVAADLCIAAIGSETAGSIRQPSSWCGTVGLKPTYGRASRAGVVAMGSSLDSPGPMGKTVEDCAILFEHIVGHDPYDGTTSSQPVPKLTDALTKGVKGMRIGIVYLDHKDLSGTRTAKAVEAAGKIFEQEGASVDVISLSTQLEKGKILSPDAAIGVYTVVQRSEVSSNLARYDGVRFGEDRSHFGAEAKRRMMLGTFTLSKGYADKYYVKALQVRSLYIQNFAELFEMYDILISASSPGFAQKLGATADNPMFGELEDMLMEPSSISGLPGISLPMHYDAKTNLYLGLSIVAPQWHEERVVAAAQVFEENTKWNSWRNL